MIKIFFILLFQIVLSQEVYEGYVLYTPQGGGGGGGGGSTSYLKDTNGSTYNSWSHSSGAASMPYLYQGDEPGFENTLLYYPCRSNNPTMEVLVEKLKFIIGMEIYYGLMKYLIKHISTTMI